jgi:large subunit ribosomal protein L35
VTDEDEMPKNKTHKGTAKRIKVSAKGKLQRQMTGRRHRLEVKPSSLTRRLEGTTEVAPADAKRIKRLLGR